MFDNTPRGRVEQRWDAIEEVVRKKLEACCGVRRVAQIGAPVDEDVEALARDVVVRAPVELLDDCGVALSLGRRPSQSVLELVAEATTKGMLPQVLTAASDLAEQFARLEDGQLLAPSSRKVEQVFERVTQLVDGSVVDEVVTLLTESSLGILDSAIPVEIDNAHVDDATVRALMAPVKRSPESQGFSLLVPVAAMPLTSKQTKLEERLGGKIVASEALDRHDALFVRTSPPSINVRLARGARLELSEASSGFAKIAITERIAWTPSEDPIIRRFRVS